MEGVREVIVGVVVLIVLLVGIQIHRRASKWVWFRWIQGAEYRKRIDALESAQSLNGEQARLAAVEYEISQLRLQISRRQEDAPKRLPVRGFAGFKRNLDSYTAENPHVPTDQG